MADSKNSTGSDTEPTSENWAEKTELENALRLGIAVEVHDPKLREIVSTLTDPQIEWVAAWLAGEGFTRSRNRSA